MPPSVSKAVTNQISHPAGYIIFFSIVDCGDLHAISGLVDTDDSKNEVQRQVVMFFHYFALGHNGSQVWCRAGVRDDFLSVYTHLFYEPQTFATY